MPAKNITVIPATIDLHTRIPKAATAFRKVAGYARVSTDSEEQLTSYEAQVDYYTRYIQSRPAENDSGIRKKGLLQNESIAWCRMLWMARST